MAIMLESGGISNFPNGNQVWMVRNTTERDQYTDTAPIGSIFHLPGYTSVWQLSEDREWISM